MCRTATCDLARQVFEQLFAIYFVGFENGCSFRIKAIGASPNGMGSSSIRFMSWNFSPRTLKNEWVTLEPLTARLFDEVCSAMMPDPHGWYTVMFGLNTPEAYRKEFSDAESFARSRYGMGFAIRDAKSGEVAGITFFLKMDNENLHLEIGTTNIAPSFRRSHVNTATKLLLLEDAFEQLQCVRVSFRVDEENLTSKMAIERLGAKYGGRLRNERILPDGRIRNYLFYDIVDSEWPGLKDKLRRRIQAN